VATFTANFWVDFEQRRPIIDSAINECPCSPNDCGGGRVCVKADTLTSNTCCNVCSGVAIAGSAGSMNPGPRPLGAPDDNGNLSSGVVPGTAAIRRRRRRRLASKSKPVAKLIDLSRLGAAPPPPINYRLLTTYSYWNPRQLSLRIA